MANTGLAAVAEGLGNLGVERGTFFKKFAFCRQDVQVSEVYPDLSQTGSSSNKIKGGTDAQYALMAFDIPYAPSFGDAQLRHLELILSTPGDGISQGVSPKAMEVVAYKIKTPEYLGQSTAGMTNVFHGGASVTEVDRKMIVGMSHVEDYFPTMTAENFSGQTGFTEKAPVLVTQRQSKMFLGTSFLSEEDAYRLGFTTKGGTTTMPRYGTVTVKAVRYSSHKKASVSRMRQKHGESILQPPADPSKADADTEVSKKRMIAVVPDSQDGWYVTRTNRPGTANWKVYFTEANVTRYGQSTSTFLEDTKEYGDEVSSENSFFTQVRGSTEYFEATAPTEEGGEIKHTLEGVGAVKYVTENVTQGGKCAQLYTYVEADPEIADYTPLRDGGIDKVVDCAAFMGPLPMPSGPYPLPPCAGQSMMGKTNHSYWGRNYGGYSTSRIDITFTIPNMTTAYVVEFDPEVGSNIHYIDIYRRSFIMGFSGVRPSLTTCRAYDFFNTDDPAPWAGLFFYKVKGGVLEAEFGSGGIYCTNIKGLASATVGDDLHGIPVSSLNSDATIGPLQEGETYRMSINIPTAHGGEWSQYNGGSWSGTVDNEVRVSIKSGDTLMTTTASKNGYINMTRDDASSDQDTFSVVSLDSPDTGTGGGLTGNSYSTKETYKYLSFWLSNTHNQNGDDAPAGYSSSTFVAGSIDSQIDASENPESKVNIDAIKIGNFSLPKYNCSVISTGKAELVEESNSNISIKSGLTRTVNSTIATSASYFHASSSLDGLKEPIDKQDSHAEVRAFNAGAGQIPGYNILSFGTQTLANFSSASDRFLFFNGFGCVNLNGNDPVPTSTTTNNAKSVVFGCYTPDMTETDSHTLVPLGFQGCHNSVTNKKAMYDGGSTVETDNDSPQGAYNGSDRDSSITFTNAQGVTKDANGVGAHTIAIDGWSARYSTSLGSIEGFSEKGMAKLEIGATLDPDWDKRENFFFSAKILHYDTLSQIATVDSTEPFKNDSDITYIAYIMGGNANDTSFYKKGIILEEIIDATHVKLNWAGLADDDVARLHETDKLPGLYISAEAYWMIWFIPNNASYEIGGTTYDATPAAGTVYYDLWSAKHFPQRTYESVLITSDDGSGHGATWNESKFSNNFDSGIYGNYSNAWELEPNDPDSIFDLKDYGYGSYVEDDAIDMGYKGGYFARGSPKTNYVSMKEAKWSMFMPEIVNADNMLPGDLLSFLVRPKDISVDHQVTFHSAGNSDKNLKPRLIANYFDPLPKPLVDVKIRPDEDKPDKTVLSWEEPEDIDLWYGLLLIDEVPITHQYHNSICHFPFNDATPDHSLPSKSQQADTLWYNYSGEKPRASVVPGASAPSQYQAANPEIKFFDFQTNTFLTPFGLQGNRTEDTTADHDFNPDVEKYSHSSGMFTRITPSSPISYLYFYANGSDTQNVFRVTPTHGSIENPVAAELLAPYGSSTTDATHERQWSIDTASRQKMSEAWSTSMIIYPKIYPPAPYDLQKTAGGDALIQNVGGTALSGLSSIVVSGTVNNADNNDVMYSDVAKPDMVYDVLAKIDSNSSNGGLTNAEYIHIPPDDGTDDTSIYIGTTAEAALMDTRAIYGTGSTDGGGGYAGVPTHGGKIQIIPRHYLFRMGIVSQLDSGNDFLMGMGTNGNDYTERVACWLDSDGLINVWIKPENQKLWMKLQSLSKVVNDGVTPTHLVVVFDSMLETGNLKIYVNGNLEASSGKRLDVGTEVNLQNKNNGQGGENIHFVTHDLGIEIGGRYGNKASTDHQNEGHDGFFGAMEEFVVYPYPIEIVDLASGSHVIERKYSELYNTDGSKPKSMFAKLFSKDYHNIRGTNNEEVQATNSIQWRKSSFALDMS